MSKIFKFKDVVIDKKGFLRGPFGGDLKKEIFVKQSKDTYKVYEQGVVLNSDKSIGRYYISKEDYLAKLYKFSVEDKDFLISCSGVNMGAIYQLKSPFEKGIINQALLRIRLNNDIIDDNYFFYLFKELISRRITSGSGDSTIPNFPALEVIKNIEFELPDKLTQVNVGKLLSSLDSKIELNNKINLELEAMAKTLYDYWFVQFDFPVVTSSGVEKPYKTSGGKMVWNEELKREIPEGWEVNEIEAFAQFVNGKGIKKEDVNDSGNYAVYGSNGITGFTNKILFKEPVIAIGRVGANYGEVHYSIAPCWISDNAVTAQPYKTFYLWWLIDTLKRINYLKIAGGSAQPLITQGQLKKLKFAVPKDTLFKDFDEIVNPIYMQLNLNIKQNQKLTELRDWLLPMLMNGQVKVSEL
jgi:type I restriction enzyme S subunit